MSIEPEAPRAAAEPEAPRAAAELDGKTALVTGGGVGIGAAIAADLAARGARVVLTYRSHRPDPAALERLRSATGEEARAVAVDLTDTDEVDRAAALVAQEVGSVDVLVHNAGGLVERSPIADMDYDLFRRVQALNVDSVFLLTRAVLPLIPTGGRIVVISSLAARTGGHPGATAYATAKAALLGFTRGLAKELAPRGITVNAVAPGFIEATPFHDTFTTPAAKAETVAGIPLGRAGVPQDVASAVGWLASPGAAFVTGTVVDVNGGQHFS
ncbi:glucose 1-dehydrogenase [Georgenia sp. TF02-10]|uniref:SDR family NAD(P)-dependent oxidoreductase n=1 Tax=Georgenia sp. TF02-10 TaxID=2917725 RepID=UPI001FA6E27B|nr:glucose 1-dehydrogenase [Georgenia sp. TF02-10]UNX54281.1 glucose 1-dehydrogenase [Georgenia sp. TF02-10]